MPSATASTAPAEKKAEKEKVLVRFRRAHFPDAGPRGYRIGQQAEIDADEAQKLKTYDVLEIIGSKGATRRMRVAETVARIEQLYEAADRQDPDALEELQEIADAEYAAGEPRPPVEKALKMAKGVTLPKAGER